VVITGLYPFSQAAEDYGVMICDPTNTMELCTNAPATSIPNYTATVTSTSVRFAIPGTFPTYPKGTAEEGRGLTFFVIIRQVAPEPIGLPNVQIQ
jgi:hypothetical protein